MNPLVPKPGTAYQWLPMEDDASIERKIKRLRALMAGIDNVYFNIKSERHSFYQALLSLGDRRVAPAIEAAERNGGNWRAAVAEAGVDADFFVFRDRSKDEVLPWDIIDGGMKDASSAPSSTRRPARSGRCRPSGRRRTRACSPSSSNRGPPSVGPLDTASRPAREVLCGLRGGELDHAREQLLRLPGLASIREARAGAPSAMRVVFRLSRGGGFEIGPAAAQSADMDLGLPPAAIDGIEMRGARPDRLVRNAPSRGELLFVEQRSRLFEVARGRVLEHQRLAIWITLRWR